VKRGNGSVTSLGGSADVLEKLGVRYAAAIPPRMPRFWKEFS
jgi:anthranilate phosphoribosyltransferase